MFSKKSRKAAPPARDLRDGAKGAHKKYKVKRRWSSKPSSFLYVSIVYLYMYLPVYCIKIPLCLLSDFPKVIEQYPSAKFHLIDAEGNLRRHFNIFVNGTHIRDLNGMDTPLKEEDKVILMASAAGG